MNSSLVICDQGKNIYSIFQFDDVFEHFSNEIIRIFLQILTINFTPITSIILNYCQRPHLKESDLKIKFDENTDADTSHQGCFCSMIELKNGYIVFASPTGSMYIYDPKAKTIIIKIAQEMSIYDYSKKITTLCEVNNIIACGSHFNTKLLLYDLKKNKQIILFDEKVEGITCLVLFRYNLLAIGFINGHVYIMDVITKIIIIRWLDNNIQITSMLALDDERLILGIGTNKIIIKNFISKDKLKVTFSIKSKCHPRTFILLPNNLLAVSMYDENENKCVIGIYNLINYKCIKIINNFIGWVMNIVHIGDDYIVVSDNENIKLYNYVNGLLIEMFSYNEIICEPHKNILAMIHLKNGTIMSSTWNGIVVHNIS